jgi:hypothetical protein
MSPFLHYEIARDVTAERRSSATTAREIRRARRARRRSRAPAGTVIELPRRRPNSWVVDRAAS